MDGCRKRQWRWYVTLMLVLECTLVEKGDHSVVGPNGHARYRGQCWEKIMGLHTKRIIARTPEWSFLVPPRGEQSSKGGGGV